MNDKDESLPSPPNFGVKLSRRGAGPAAELPTFIASVTASRRLHFASRCRQLLGGKRRAASASARGTGRAAYTKNVRRLMEFQELLAPVSGEPDIADALESWSWLVPAGARAILATALGDVFVTAADGSVYFLDIISGRCDRVAESMAQWDEMLQDLDFLEQHFTPGFVALLRERSGVLAQGECYVPKHEPVLGGSWEAENWSPGKWVWHLERQGRVHFSIKDLPDGTKITEWNYTDL